MSAIGTARIQQVIRRDNGLCQLRLPGCLWWADTADHRANRGQGGSKVLNAFSCLVAACSPCNFRKEDLHGEDREELEERGLIIVRDSTNAKTAARALATPYTDPDGISWWLDDYAGKERVDARQPF